MILAVVVLAHTGTRCRRKTPGSRMRGNDGNFAISVAQSGKFH